MQCKSALSEGEAASFHTFQVMHHSVDHMNVSTQLCCLLSLESAIVVSHHNPRIKHSAISGIYEILLDFLRQGMSRVINRLDSWIMSSIFTRETSLLDHASRSSPLGARVFYD